MGVDQKNRPKGWSLDRVAAAFNAKTFCCPDDSYVIDTETWLSIDGDLVFSRIDKCTCFVGSQLLYHRLRHPHLHPDSFEPMELLIGSLSEAPQCFDEVESILEKLKEIDGWNAHSLLNQSPGDLPIAPWLLWLATVSALVALTCASIFGSWFWGAALACFAVNTWIHFRVSLHASASMSSIFALRKLVRVGQELRSINKIASFLQKMDFDAAIARTKDFARGGFLLDFKEPTGALEYLKICTLYDARFFISKFRYLESRKEALKQVFLAIGFLDNCVSILRMRNDSQTPSSIPVHHTLESFTFEDCFHPLIDQENVVSNSIEIHKPGVILTGLNMAGKSTFLRSVAISALLSQTIHTVFCSRYQGPLCKVFAVMKTEDSLPEGKSHFMQELTSIQRLVEVASDFYPCLLIVDEMFRGTNSDERIATSSAVTTYLGSKKNTIVSTHDLEVISHAPSSFDKYNFSGLVESEGGLCFDFVLRRGMCRDRNAIRLLQNLGYPGEVLTSAKTICAQLDASLSELKDPRCASVERP